MTAVCSYVCISNIAESFGRKSTLLRNPASLLMAQRNYVREKQMLEDSLHVSEAIIRGKEKV